MTKILLGFNCNCFTNRYDMPSDWAAICRQVGIRHVMFSIDLIDPNWPWDLQRRLCDDTLDACARNGVTIQCSFGGHHGHQHYLGHPDKEVRNEAEAFIRRAIRQTAYLNGKSFGTCFAILTDKCNRDERLRREIIDDAITAYHHLAEYGVEVGLKALTYEMTSVARETCATFKENDEILQRCDNMSIPMHICLDIGHRNMSASVEEADHLAWIHRYGSRCNVIDCHQTDLSSSRHWPFTDEYNNKGIIRGDEVANAIHASGAEEVMLAFEIRTPAYYPHDDQHLEHLKSSVDYWRQWVTD